MERLIGKGFVFHDAEIELVHLDRKAHAATFRTWTWSAVDYSKHYYVDWRLDHCIYINLPDYEMNGASPFIWDMGFELDPDFPERITVYFNGTSVSAVRAQHLDSLVWNRSRDSLKHEWAVHNAFHALGLSRKMKWGMWQCF